MTDRFAIIDVETTGGLSKRDKITEIAIIVYQDGQILDTFESLINPERSIPFEITRMTGITNEMVENAPKFYEIAKNILQLTEGCVFVAHNVFFDYNFIREEFQQLGYNYSRKKLCTVQLSRRYFKGLKSYSLGSLIDHFEIKVTNRHRAMDDTKATLEIFTRILKDNELSGNGKLNIPALLKENKIPSHLDKDQISNLPEQAGVYFMRDNRNVPIYIGKSKNIRERIYQHFNDVTIKTKKLMELVYTIDYLETGNELMASLIEAREIKKYQPEINRALRRKTHATLMTAQLHEHDFCQFEIKEAEWLDSNDEIVNHYSTRTAAKEHLEYLIYSYQLCKKINGGNKDGLPCYSYQLGQCHGACIGKESYGSYNDRFGQAYSEINKIFKESFYILGEGRSPDENSVVLIENGFCSFIGYLDRQVSYRSISEIKEFIESYKGNVETNRIIEHYLAKGKEYKKVLISL